MAMTEPPTATPSPYPYPPSTPPPWDGRQQPPPPYFQPPKPKQRTGLLAALIVGAVAVVAMLIGGLAEWHNYGALQGICRTAVVAEAQSRLSAARSVSSSVPVSVSVTDIEVSDPIYDGPFKATVPAKFSAQMSASIMSRDTSVPLQCNANFSGSWHVTVTNAVR